MKEDTIGRQFFESKYRENSDPWGFASSEYEQSRYQVTLSALNHRRYKWAFEPGCSIGILTACLAEICDRVEAMDISYTAVKQARERCKKLANVNIVCGKFPAVMPTGRFDLIVLSEIGYYFREEQLHILGQQLRNRLRKTGLLLAVHWLGNSEDHLLGGIGYTRFWEASTIWIIRALNVIRTFAWISGSGYE